MSHLTATPAEVQPVPADVKAVITHLSHSGKYPANRFERQGDDWVNMYGARIVGPLMDDYFAEGLAERDPHETALPPISGGSPVAESFALAYSPLPDPIQALPLSVRPIARFLAKPVWTWDAMARIDAITGRAMAVVEIAHADDRITDEVLEQVSELIDEAEAMISDYRKVGDRMGKAFSYAEANQVPTPVTFTSKPIPVKPVVRLVKRDAAYLLEGACYAYVARGESAIVEHWDGLNEADRKAVGRHLISLGWPKLTRTYKAFDRFSEFVRQCQPARDAVAAQGCPIASPQESYPVAERANAVDTLPPVPEFSELAPICGGSPEAEPTYRYRIKSMDASSAKYGACEVCGKNASDVHYQVEEQEYEPGQWTVHGCRCYFGHASCLESKRRDSNPLPPLSGGSPELDTPPAPVFPDEEWDNGDRPDDDHDTPSSWDGFPEPFDPDSTVLDIPVTPEDHEADEWALYDACESMIIAGSRRSRLAHVEDAIRTIILHILETEVRIGQAARVTWKHRMSAERREDFLEWVSAHGITIDPNGDAPTDPAEMFEWLCVECRDGSTVDFPEPTPTPDPDGDDDDAVASLDEARLPLPAGLRAGHAGQDHRAEESGPDRDGGRPLPAPGGPGDHGALPRLEAPAPAPGDVEAPDTLTCSSETSSNPEPDGGDDGDEAIGPGGRRECGRRQYPQAPIDLGRHHDAAHGQATRAMERGAEGAGLGAPDHDRQRPPALGPAGHDNASLVIGPDTLNPLPGFSGGDDEPQDHPSVPVLLVPDRSALGSDGHRVGPRDLDRHGERGEGLVLPGGLERGLGGPGRDAGVGVAGSPEATPWPDTLTIDGRAYGVSWRLGYLLLEKDERTTYEVTTDPLGRPWCSCPDAIHRRNGLDSRGCRHYRAALAAGLVPQAQPAPPLPGPVPEFFRNPCPAWIDAAAL